MGRKYVNDVIDEIPHLIHITEVRALALDQVPGTFWAPSDPNAFVMLNSFTRSHCKNWRIYSADQTNVVGDKDPDFKEDIKLVSMGPGKIVVNVFAKFILIAEALMGQAVVDLAKYPQIAPGTINDIEVHLRPKRVPMYDAKGVTINCEDVPPDAKLGKVKMTFSIPKRLENFCGDFVQVKEDGWGGSTQEDVWIEQDQGTLKFFKSPMEDKQPPDDTILCSDIIKFEDFVHTPPPPAEGEEEHGPMAAFKIYLEGHTVETPNVRSLVWGEESGLRKGLWKYVLSKNVKKEEEKNEDEEKEEAPAAESSEEELSGDEYEQPPVENDDDAASNA